MSKNKVTNKEIQEMFQEGNLIARALYTDNIRVREGKVGYSFEEFNNEVKFLNSKKQDGFYQNVERDGQRNRSATLLVPNVNMDLFSDIGLLYDGDKSTIRAYMYHDSVTVSGTEHDKFYNVNIDKQKFEPIISKKEFLEKYKNYRASTDNTEQEHVKYNEVLANFFPESITGLVARDDSPTNKLRLLAAKNFLIDKYNLDLPMVIMDKGKIQTWAPDLKEVCELLNANKYQIEKLALKSPETTKEHLLDDFIKNLGFATTVKDFNKPLLPENLIILNKNELTSKEIINFVHETTGIPKGGKFTYGIEGRLKEVVNQRRENEGLEKVNDLKNTIIDKQDIKNLVTLLDTEVSRKSPKIPQMDKKEINELSGSIMQEIRAKRQDEVQDKNNIQSIKSKLVKHIPSNSFSRIKEFFNKVVSLFEERQVSKAIQQNKHSKISRNF